MSAADAAIAWRQLGRYLRKRVLGAVPQHTTRRPDRLQESAGVGSARRRKHQHVARVGLFGLFGIGNLGNDGSLEAMLNLLRRERPDAELLCICGCPEVVEPKFRLASTRINQALDGAFWGRLNRLLFDLPRELACIVSAVRTLRGLDALVIPGTGILDDFGTGPRGMPYWLFRWCVLARLLGVRIVFANIGAGPIRHPLSRWLMKTAAGLADYRSYRDDISRDFMAGIGADVSRDPVYPDIAFMLREPAPLRAPSLEGSPLTVGVGVMSYNGWRQDKARDGTIHAEYLLKLERFVPWLLDAGYRVRLLTGEESDLAVVEELLARITAQRNGRDWPEIVAEPSHSLHDLMAQIADTDVVVATRFHNVVCALKLGRPTLSIGYAKKNEVLLREMGLGDFSQNIEELDVDRLIEQFRRLVAGRHAHGRKIAGTNAAFAGRLRHQQALLLSEYL
jgi:polysaccharide pyruvyl transferase WcaK-like protein